MDMLMGKYFLWFVYTHPWKLGKILNSSVMVVLVAGIFLIVLSRT